ASNPLIGNGPPYVVRIAGRVYDFVFPPVPFLYGPPGPLNSSGEMFPLLVPPRTLLMADGANSEQDLSGNTARVIIQGDLYTPGATVPRDTILFSAGGTDNFTSEGGLDGTEIRPYGIEVIRGVRNVFLE